MMVDRLGTPLRHACARLVPQPLVGILTGCIAAALTLWLQWGSPIVGGSGSHQFLLALLLTSCAIASYPFPLHLGNRTKLYLSSVPYFLLSVAVTPPLAAISAGVGVALGETSVNRQRGNYPSDIATQVGRRMIVVGLASLVAHVEIDNTPHFVPAMLAAGVLLVGDILTSPLLLTPMTGKPPGWIIARVARDGLPVEAAQYLMGLVVVFAVARQFWMMTVLALPVVLLYHAFRASAEAREAQQAAEDAEHRARTLQVTAETSEMVKGAILEAAQDSIITFDSQGRVVELNPAAETLFACDQRTATRHDIAYFLPRMAAFGFGPLPGAWQSVRRHDTCARRADGTEIPVEVTITALPLQPPLHAAFVRDVTVERQAAEALRHQALHDSLTGLPNRALLHDRLQYAILTATRERKIAALLLLDLDGFKGVNDGFGHAAGDVLLQDFGSRLLRVVRKTDTVSRLGGDEFAIVLLVQDVEDVLGVVDKIEAMLDAPFAVAGRSLAVRASVGIALCPEHGSETDILLQHADAAMYAAKRAYRSYAMYDPNHDMHHPDRLAVMMDLRHAVDRSELLLDYQPIVSLKTGQIERMEALVRWRHPRRGLVPPQEFIPLAEETGLIGPLTLWVLEAALQQSRTWRAMGHVIPIAVNVSPAALRHPEIRARMMEVLSTDETAGTALQVEITESALMMDLQWAAAALQPFRELGVRVAIDDFGTGHSSLARLKHLPVDEIKIDRGFVQTMTGDNSDCAIVRSVIALAHQLGLVVVAEGCENRATRALLAASECDLVQGYEVSRPLPPAELAAWLKGHGDRMKWAG